MGIFAAGYFIRQEISLQDNLLVPFEAFILASVTAVVSFIGYLVRPSNKFVYGLSFTIYLLLAATAAFLVVATGTATSPFIALWMLIAVFAGLFGLLGIVTVLLAVNGYLAASLVVESLVPQQDLVVFLLAGELPILVSYLIWHSRKNHETEKDKAFNAMAAELSEVSDNSQIVINAIADGVIAIDRVGTIQLINPAAQSYLGWSQKDSLNLDYKLVLKLSDAKGQPLSEADNIVNQVLLTNKTVANDNLTLTTNSGKQLQVSLTVSPAGLRGSGAIIVFRDVTQQKAEERQQTEFISTASHEMRTPVASIEGYLGLALNPQTATIDEKARQYLEKAHESARHLGHLFQDLLDVTKVDDGRISNNPTIIDATAFTADITSAFEMKAKEKNLMLYFKPGTPSDTGNDLNKKLSPVFYIDADMNHLREVLSNLVENAIKYTPQGSVTVDVTGDDTNVTVSVHDSGIGIPPEDVGHLFQKFYRVDNSATREIGGTGLGLYLCRRLVESMNGKIWVESEFGKGSTFYVQFARVSHEDAAAKLEASVEQQQQQVQQAQPALGQTPPPPDIPQPTVQPQPQPVSQPQPVAAEPAPQQSTQSPQPASQAQLQQNQP